MESKSLNKEATYDKKKGILLVIGATLSTAIGITFLKIGVEKFSFSLFSLINAPFIAGVFFYFLSSALLIMGLKHGSLSTLYPFVSLGYIWIILISVIVFRENPSSTKLTGSAMIIVGVCLIGMKDEIESKITKVKTRYAQKKQGQQSKITGQSK